MRFIADLQIHSKYSRATSKDMTLENLDFWARVKGIKVLGTGDFTHPLWLKELKEKLEEAEPGLFVLKEKFRKQEQGISNDPTRFMLTAEVSLIYTKLGKVRKVHHVLWAPDFKSVEAINTRLSWVGNLSSDGRPIIGITSEELAEIVSQNTQTAVIIPAHVWTPWFSIFGSKSGFDSVEECFEKWSDKIFALETGLSSDPPMNWRISKFDKYTLVSNSDSHSLQRIGREANAFDTDLSYDAIINAIKSKDPKKFLYTIEFFPEQGRYHIDGHASCGVALMPKQTKLLKGICPKCKKPLTIGVLYRTESLADRPPDFTPNQFIPYRNLIPLDEIIAESIGVKSKTKKVWSIYFSLIKHIGPEIYILTQATLEDIAKISQNVAQGIQRVRDKKLYIEPGFDGQYGKVHIFKPEELVKQKQQDSLL
jgi:DNA helicase-2/ATP-dependent DNA helicase PcrA